MNCTNEETVEFCYKDTVKHPSVARGGPIFGCNHVGPTTSISDFKASLLEELHELEAELNAADDLVEDISVDDLKVFTEEELVEKALKKAFDDFRDKEQTNPVDEHVSANKSTSLELSALLNGSSASTCSAGVASKDSQPKKCKKRGRLFDRDMRAAELESSYFEKVKQLAKIKERQDEEKIAAKLHSFSGSSKSTESAATALDKIEKMKSLKSAASMIKVKTSPSNVHVPVHYPEVVIYVEIYYQSMSNKVQEFLVLGSQTLTDLRDNIYCLTDKLMQAAEKHDASGNFF